MSQDTNQLEALEALFIKMGFEPRRLANAIVGTVCMKHHKDCTFAFDYISITVVYGLKIFDATRVYDAAKKDIFFNQGYETLEELELMVSRNRCIKAYLEDVKYFLNGGNTRSHDAIPVVA